MTIEEIIRAALCAELAPLRAEIRHLVAQVGALRRTVPPAVVTVQEASRLRRVHASTIRRWLKDGTLRAVPTGKGKKCLVDLSTAYPPTESTAENAVPLPRAIESS